MNEKTSKRAASAGARALAYKPDAWLKLGRQIVVFIPIEIWKDAQSGCASAVTQRPDRRKRHGNGRSRKKG